MDLIINYVKPELLVLAIALYLIGIAVKNTKMISDKYIPLILGIVGIALSLIYVLATGDFSTSQNTLMAVFTGIVQGVLVAGLSTYVNQMIKQLGTDEEVNE